MALIVARFYELRHMPRRQAPSARQLTRWRLSGMSGSRAMMVPAVGWCSSRALQKPLHARRLGRRRAIGGV